MVGSGEGGGDSRSRDAMGMVALHEALRNICLTSDWTYSVFWTIRPRPRSRGGNACKIGDDNGSLMLMWEDGFCRARAATEHMEGTDGEDLVRKAFSKMSIQLYNYGEGLMGKVASDKCHKWVFKEPSECEPSISNYWQSSFDALPPEWTDQFASGIQTIAVIQAGHGLLQLGSCKIIPEDLHFVLRMRQMFESLGYQSGFFLSQLFSSTRNKTASSSLPKQMPLPCPPQIFNWSYSSSLHPPPVYQPSPHVGGLLAGNKDGTHIFLPHSAGAGTHLDEAAATAEHESSDLRWPNGLSFFTALTGEADDAKLLFGNRPQGQQHPLMSLYGADEETKAVPDGDSNTEDFLSLESHSNSNRGRKMETCDSKRGLALPTRMTTSSSSSSLDRDRAVAAQSMEHRVSEAGIYTDIMENFLN